MRVDGNEGRMEHFRSDAARMAGRGKERAWVSKNVFAHRCEKHGHTQAVESSRRHTDDPQSIPGTLHTHAHLSVDVIIHHEVPLAHVHVLISVLLIPLISCRADIYPIMFHTTRDAQKTEGIIGTGVMPHPRTSTHVWAGVAFQF